MKKLTKIDLQNIKSLTNTKIATVRAKVAIWVAKDQPMNISTENMEVVMTQGDMEEIKRCFYRECEELEKLTGFTVYNWQVGGWDEGWDELIETGSVNMTAMKDDGKEWCEVSYALFID